MKYNIGVFKIVSEAGTAAGVRRIEAVTGAAALSYMAANVQLLNDAAAQLKIAPESLPEKLMALVQHNKDLTKELQGLKAKLAGYAAADWLADAVDVGGIKVLAKQTEGLDADAQLDVVDQLKNKLGAAVVLLVTLEGDKASLVAGVTKAQSKQFKAGDLVRDIAEQLGGKGGGRPDMARGACSASAPIAVALDGVAAWVNSRL